MAVLPPLRGQGQPMEGAALDAACKWGWQGFGGPCAGSGAPTQGCSVRVALLPSPQRCSQAGAGPHARLGTPFLLSHVPRLYRGTSVSESRNLS